MQDEAPILYSFRRCPYAMRARMALSVADISCRLREVVLRDKPAEMLAASPKGTVPVIVQSNGHVIDESLDVMRWALRRNDPEGWLKPPTENEAAMLALIARCDGPFKHALDRYKYPNRYVAEKVEREDQRAIGLNFLCDLNARLEHQAYLFGDRISLADIAIFPFIRQFANTDRAWFDALDLADLQRWLEAHLTSPLFSGIMAKYPQWRSGDNEVAFPPAPSAA